MGNLNAENIKRGLGCCKGSYDCFTCDIYKRGCAGWRDGLAKDALSLINELTAENESLIQCMEHEHASFMETCGEYGEKCESLEIELNAMRTAANSYKMHYEKLEAENERLRADNEIKSQKRANIFEIVNSFERGRNNGVRKYRECLYRELASLGAKDKFNKKFFLEKADQIAKEMLNDES